MKASSFQPFSPKSVLIFGVFAVAMSSIFIRFAQSGAPSLTIAAYRLFISGMVLTPFAIAKNRKEMAAMKKEDYLFVLLSAFLLAVHFHAWITSLEYTSVASSVVIVNTSPLWLALLARIFLKEEIRSATLIGLGVALIGGVIVALSESCSLSNLGFICPNLDQLFSGKAYIGNLLALLGALTGAGYYLMGRKLRPSISLLSYISLVYGLAGVILVIYALINRVPLFGFSPSTYLWLILLALVPQILGHSSFNYALGYLPAVYISLPLLGEPIISAILAHFILDETPGPLKIIGGTLIISGIILGLWPNNQQQNAQV